MAISLIRIVLIVMKSRQAIRTGFDNRQLENMRETHESGTQRLTGEMMPLARQTESRTKAEKFPCDLARMATII